MKVKPRCSYSFAACLIHPGVNLYELIYIVVMVSRWISESVSLTSLFERRLNFGFVDGVQVVRVVHHGLRRMRSFDKTTQIIVAIHPGSD
jgi:hypothetical protein